MAQRLTGEIVCGGKVRGKVRLITDPDDVSSVEPGEIVVVPCSHPQYSLALLHAAGLICEGDGIISHICTVALELGIPCLAEVSNATTVLSTSMSVTLDADRGVVYAE